VKHRKRIPKATWTFPNFENVFTWRTYSFNVSYKKQEVKKKSKWDTQNLDIVQKATKINRRIEAIKQTKGDQVKHLWG
jgi:hypothetical protein